MSTSLFWTAVAVILYAYAGYPLLQLTLAHLWPRRVRKAPVTPRVSLVICAHNEVASIEKKIENVLALDYPLDRLEVLIASDGSTDGTNEIVSRCLDPRVRLLELPRQGKIPALNAAVAEASGEVLVFSDANSMYAPDAIRALVAPFADPTVGGVAGDQRYVDDPSHAESGGERAYWNFDRQLKKWQSAFGSVTSATGAIYALRRSLFRSVPSSVTDDFFSSTCAIATGHRLVFEPEAIAFEQAASSSGAEFQRKVRVITRGLRGVLERSRLLDPGRTGFYSLQLFSHKVLRRLVAVPLCVLFVVTPFAWNEGLVYRAALLAQLAVYTPALLALVFPRLQAASRLFSVPFFFCMVNAAALMAAANVARGRRIDIWNPQRAPSAPRESMP